MPGSGSTSPDPAARCVVLTGPPAAGKSTAGRIVARALGLPFADVDECVSRAAGASVAELFAREGERGFRAREREALFELLGRGERTVVSAGAGALAERSVRHRVLARAVVVSLAAPVEVLAARAANERGLRPLLGEDPRAALGALLEQRAAGYAEAHAVVPATGPPEQVAAAVLAAVRGPAAGALVVPLGARTYRVEFAGVGALPERIAAISPPASGVVLVADARAVVLPAVRSALRALAPRAVVRLPGRGDRDKTLRNVQRVWEAALRAGADRDALILAVGGGVASDLAGFAAATLLRGVRYATVPTTLLAMADASVGGKTGIDLPAGKNLVGAFHQPSLVLCDPSVLNSLPARRMREGMAEVAKVALACDAGLLELLEASAAGVYDPAGEAFGAALRHAVQAKIDVVAQDEREGGRRAVLNFGHTVGHALEAGSGYRMPHGECVALGMRAALRLGRARGVTPAALAERGEALLDALGMPRAAGRGVDVCKALAALGRDKKRRGEELRFVLCDAPGSSVVSPVPAAAAAGALRSVLEIR